MAHMMAMILQGGVGPSCPLGSRGRFCASIGARSRTTQIRSTGLAWLSTGVVPVMGQQLFG